MYRTLWLVVLSLLTLGLVLVAPAQAQGPADLSATAAADPAGPDPAAAASPAPAAPLPDTPSSGKGATADSGWRGAISVYGWFPAVHGTVGVLGHNAGFYAPFSDLFHTLKGIIPIAVEADKGRFVMPVDFLWMKLGDDKGVPFNELGQTSVNIHITQSLLTPKFGYRLVDTDHWKIDALAGIRYWYLGQNLSVEPSGVNRSRSANWVDGLGGARITLVLSPKVSIIAAGDAGGGGANLDYQVIGLLNLKFTEHLGLGLGWRYLDVDYEGNHQFVYDTITSGALAGFYYTLGGKPPVPVSASCSASPAEIWSGDPVTATIDPQNFNPKHTLTYKWASAGAKISGTGTTANVDTTGLAPGNYNVSGTVTDAKEKEKKNNIATCSASFTVKQPQPPQVSCSASPTTIAINEPSTITMTATDPQGWPMTYSWTNNGGQLSGSGTSVTVTATNADAGNTITVTGTANDARASLSGTCTAQVNVPAVKTCVNVEDWGECTFEKNPKKPWRVDNDCKDTLDRLSLRLQQMPNGKLNVVGYTDEQESVNVQTLGSQRSVNVKYYLTTDGPTKVDASRVQPRAGGTKGKASHFYFVPEGTLCGGQLEEGTVVDESQTQPQSRNAPAPKKKAHKAQPASPPAQ